MNKEEIIKRWVGVSIDAPPLTPMDKGECIICMEAYAEQERIKAKIETLTKFRYRSYESIEEELNNLKKQLDNDK